MAETASFVCKIMTSDGAVVERIVEGETRALVEDYIRQRGERPIEIVPQLDKGSKDISELGLFKKKIKAKDLSLFCKQMFTMIHAGMPLIRALGVMAEQVEHPTLKEVCAEMMGDVQKGRMFSEAMKKHGNHFPPLLISMVESGEMTGKQDEVLEKMAIHYQKEDRIEKKIKSAMIYPKFLSVLTIVVVMIMLTFVLPMFAKVYAEGGVELPAITQFVMGISDGVVKNWYIIIAVVIALTVGFKTFVSTPGGKRAWDKFLLSVPGVSNSVKKVATSRFTRTLSTLLSSGLPLLASLQMSGRVTGNTVVEDGIDSITEDIKKGSTLSSLIKQINLFPSMLISMISIGEESGSLEDMLERTSDFYDEELEAALTQLVGLVEPVMILVMGVIIGFIVLAMLMPMFTLFTAFQNR